MICELACNCVWSDGFGGDDFCCSGERPAYKWTPSRKLPMPWNEEGLSVCVSDFGRDGVLAAGYRLPAGVCVAGDAVIN